MEDLQRADPSAHHHADRERVDVKVRDDQQVARLAAAMYGGSVHGFGLHDVAKMFACVSIAPFGVPVVPSEVVVLCPVARLDVLL